MEPWGEAETRNVRDFILAREGDWVVFDDVHAFGKFILLPFSYSATEYPANFDELKEIAESGASAMKSVDGHNYKVKDNVKIILALFIQL